MRDVREPAPLQGMRQDCTVQHIRNGLAARVYEAHARAALDYGDVAEYNQCQSQVAVLYQGEDRLSSFRGCWACCKIRTAGANCRGRCCTRVTPGGSSCLWGG